MASCRRSARSQIDGRPRHRREKLRSSWCCQAGRACWGPTAPSRRRRGAPRPQGRAGKEGAACSGRRLGRDRLPASGTFPDVGVVGPRGRAVVPVVALLQLLLLRLRLLLRRGGRNVAPLDEYGCLLRHADDDRAGPPAGTPTGSPARTPSRTPTRAPAPARAPTAPPAPTWAPDRGADDDAHADTAVAVAAATTASGKCRSARANHREQRHGSHGGVLHLHADNNAPEPDPVDRPKRVVTTFTSVVAAPAPSRPRRSKPARGPGHAGGLPSGPGIAERSDK